MGECRGPAWLISSSAADVSTVQATRESANLNEAPRRLVDRAWGCGDSSGTGTGGGLLTQKSWTCGIQKFLITFVTFHFLARYFSFPHDPRSAPLHQQGEHILNSFSRVWHRVALNQLFYGGKTNSTVRCRHDFDAKKKKRSVSDVFRFFFWDSSSSWRSRYGFVGSQKSKIQCKVSSSHCQRDASSVCQ